MQYHNYYNILEIFPTKKIEIQMLNVRGDEYAE